MTQLVLSNIITITSYMHLDKHSITLHSFHKNFEIVSINGSTEFIVTAPVSTNAVVIQ